jgi:hypothetical protein
MSVAYVAAEKSISSVMGLLLRPFFGMSSRAYGDIAVGIKNPACTKRDFDEAVWFYETDLTISSTTFFASPNTIMVLSM